MLLFLCLNYASTIGEERGEVCAAKKKYTHSRVVVVLFHFIENDGFFPLLLLPSRLVLFLAFFFILPEIDCQRTIETIGKKIFKTSRVKIKIKIKITTPWDFRCIVYLFLCWCLVNKKRYDGKEWFFFWWWWWWCVCVCVCIFRARSPTARMRKMSSSGNSFWRRSPTMRKRKSIKIAIQDIWTKAMPCSILVMILVSSMW